MVHEFLLTKDVATMFAVSIITVQRWCRAGRIPHFRVSRKTLRFRREELEEWIKKKHENGNRILAA